MVHFFPSQLLIIYMTLMYIVLLESAKLFLENDIQEWYALNISVCVLSISLISMKTYRYTSGSNPFFFPLTSEIYHLKP